MMYVCIPQPEEFSLFGFLCLSVTGSSTSASFPQYCLGINHNTTVMHIFPFCASQRSLFIGHLLWFFSPWQVADCLLGDSVAFQLGLFLNKWIYSGGSLLSDVLL